CPGDRPPGVNHAHEARGPALAVARTHVAPAIERAIGDRISRRVGPPIVRLWWWRRERLVGWWLDTTNDEHEGRDPHDRILARERPCGALRSRSSDRSRATRHAGEA